MRHVPILHEIAKRVLTLTEGGKTTKVARDPNRPWTFRENACPDWDMSTLAWLAARYSPQGLSVSAIHQDLQVINSITRLPAVVQLNSTTAALVADDL